MEFEKPKEMDKKQRETPVGEKKLSYNIERVRLDGFVCKYVYKFRTQQFLEDVDDLSYFGISPNDYKEHLIEALVGEFKIALNNVIFGDPAGRPYVEENNKIRNGTWNTRNGGAKITPEQVQEIRMKLKNGEQQKLLAIEYGVSRPTITRIANYKIWKNI